MSTASGRECYRKAWTRADTDWTVFWNQTNVFKEHNKRVDCSPDVDRVCVILFSIASQVGSEQNTNGTEKHGQMHTRTELYSESNQTPSKEHNKRVDCSPEVDSFSFVLVFCAWLCSRILLNVILLCIRNIKTAKDLVRKLMETTIEKSWLFKSDLLFWKYSADHIGEIQTKNPHVRDRRWHWEINSAKIACYPTNSYSWCDSLAISSRDDISKIKPRLSQQWTEWKGVANLGGVYQN
jgi:hypothetical protein